MSRYICYLPTFRKTLKNAQQKMPTTRRRHPFPSVETASFLLHSWIEHPNRPSIRSTLPTCTHFEHASHFPIDWAPTAVLKMRHAPCLVSPSGSVTLRRIFRLVGNCAVEDSSHALTLFVHLLIPLGCGGFAVAPCQGHSPCPQSPGCGGSCRGDPFAIEPITSASSEWACPGSPAGSCTF